MGIGILVLFSLLVKSFGSVLEIGSQALVSQFWGVEAYGIYTFFIAIAEGFYALFFSGIIKFNNYYIPQGVDIKCFRKKYYLYYAIPICVILIILSVICHNIIGMAAFITGFIYLCAMDTSSRMMSYGRYKPALIGEYCIGRAFLILSILVISFTYFRDIKILYLVYGTQFGIILLYYLLINKKAPLPNVCNAEVGKKTISQYIIYQSTEIAHTIIMQTPVIVQYLFGGAYQTALISIVLVVRKVINFISGPTSKLYQPEFAKKAAEKDIKGLSEIYARITKIQLCFMLPIFTFLVTKPELILYIFNSELIAYGWLVKYTAYVFMAMIVFGPLSNFLPMVGKEKMDVIANWSSVFFMYLIMVLFRSNPYFVVIGFCSQILYINFFKFIVFLLHMKCMPIPIKNYIQILIIFILACLSVFIFHELLIVSIFICIIQFCINFLIVFPKDDLQVILNKIQIRKK